MNLDKQRKSGKKGKVEKEQRINFKKEDKRKM